MCRPSLCCAPGGAKGVLEFFLRALEQVCRVLELPLYVGTHRLGVHIGGPVPTEQVARLVSGWVQFGDDEKARLRSSRELLLPVCVDPQGNGKSSDWLFLRLRSSDADAALNEGGGLDVEVAEYSAVLDALNSCADLTKDSHLVTREVKFRTLEV